MFILRYGQIERENEETEFRREMEELGFVEHTWIGLDGNDVVEWRWPAY